MSGVPTITLNHKEARRQQYTSPLRAAQAAVRAARWLKNPRNQSSTPPGHIARKIKLLKIAEGKG